MREIEKVTILWKEKVRERVKYASLLSHNLLSYLFSVFQGLSQGEASPTYSS